ncbi:aminotransferase class I/II-fold pyridoxal phosphate-dependent enzyme [Chitinophaga lutea]|uniref:Aminotransferase class I/II-fold pyridoxal phosphate-dependent enzyme n=1 Tax=Chitinophaga lutea TaxID=2488634 RepID=A0A3N4QN55_9BACT|nr:aminotransferase class I/II-fold pyridoxal phosphate-dependent enzyme [Chitinophaga lutea]RPE13134.1 aminotransferase class I/II-fold pyridoxal phosphate-dependent enzyme [Chitinophaga lutea]
MDLSYIINELGEERDLYFNAIAPPIVQSSNFAFDTVAALRELLLDEYNGFLYSRGNNPTIDILRQKLAALDGAEDALVFGSGAAAIFTTVLSQLKKGDHVVCVRDPYSWARRLFENILPRFGVDTTFVDGTATAHFEAALQPNTALIYLESPNSLTFELQDVAAIAQLARSRGITTIIDNSYCTPLYQQAHVMGIDLCLQSATKFISGHSDTMAGVVTGTREKIRRIFASEFLNIGSGIAPFNAWLLLRGLRTLEIRLQRSAASTAKVVERLKRHPLIEKIFFPLDPDFPQYELATRQMKGAAGLLTIQLKADNRDQVELFCNSLQHFLMAVSWGGHESLAFPACASLKAEDFNVNEPKHRMVRLYIGLEDPGYLIADLEQALEKIGKA